MRFDHHSSLVTRHSSLIIAAALAAATTAHAAPTYTIPAPNGVGDVVTLTNVLATMETDAASAGLTLRLEPGVYDLRGIKMSQGNHLYVRHTRNALITGLGQTPGDTILLGGGEADKCRVAYVVGGGNYWTTTISNLTVTGGYVEGNGGGICAGNTSVLYDTCIISNNVSIADATTNNGRSSGGGGCYCGRARNCLFADNRTTGAGGGISTLHRNGANQTFTAASIVNCVFTNNSQSGTCFWLIWEGVEYATGGGAVCVPAGAIISGTRFLGNSATTRGGALCVFGGKGSVSDCTFVNNASTEKEGGAIYGWVAVTNCTFSGNSSHNDGGAIYAATSPLPSEAVGCHFDGNRIIDWGHGGAIRTKDNVPRTQVLSCVFSGNSAAQGQSAFLADLTDCVISNHLTGTYVLYNCNLTRCRVRDNHLKDWASYFDYSSSLGAYTNVNCEFSSNIGDSMTIASVSKVNVNCTYFGNVFGAGNYSHIIKNCLSYNCILAENKIGNSMCDVRAHDLNGDCELVMTNCLFTRGDSYLQIDGNGFAVHDGVSNCRRVANMKLEVNATGDHVPTARSRANDAGLADAWILAAVGDTDLAGNRRVFGDGLDIGALECQAFPPALRIIVR